MLILNFILTHDQLEVLSVCKMKMITQKKNMSKYNSTLSLSVLKFAMKIISKNAVILILYTIGPIISFFETLIATASSLLVGSKNLHSLKTEVILK